MELVFNTEVVSTNFPIWEGEIKDIPFDRDFFENTLKWKDNELVHNKHTFFGQERKEYEDSIESQNFINWLEEFKEKNNILELISNLLDLETNQAYFYREYPVSGKVEKIYDFLKNKCNIRYRVLKDEPGYKMANHFDNRSVFGNLFINLTTNNNVSTHFVNTFTNTNKTVLDTETKIHYKAPIKKNQGIFFLNTSDTLHGIENNSNEQRFIFNAVVYFESLISIK